MEPAILLFQSSVDANLVLCHQIAHLYIHLASKQFAEHLDVCSCMYRC
jgi:hypothetical protein